MPFSFKRNNGNSLYKLMYTSHNDIQHTYYTMYMLICDYVPFVCVCYFKLKLYVPTLTIRVINKHLITYYTYSIRYDTYIDTILPEK